MHGIVIFLNQEKLVYLQEFLKTRKLVLDATFEEFYLGSRDLGSVIDAHLDYISTKEQQFLQPMICF